MFIDVGTFSQRICNSMPQALGWTQALLSPEKALPRLTALSENDPGSKPLPPRILASFQRPARGSTV
jgi:hypothetical protein